ncbi:uncharacterized protein LOC131170684 [Hevea brasiliensis]|uniref:uncharacterized protein LOC131170684 n=1 Tax=Hevea brasiliensis TaxID=3981 RepID=UPI0025CC64AF|nr:uncharacterized protein LOC131170684 [Hevea brasiliensis]
MLYVLIFLQFSSVAEQDYDEARRTSGFVTEHIFPGGCLPSLTRITSAMGAASKLRVESVENIGRHLYRTMKCWRKSFLENRR